MKKKRDRKRAAYSALAIVALVALAVVPSASAHTGEFARFNNCPSTTAGVNKCLYAITSGGKVVLGNKTVPIVNPVTVQGGYGFPAEEGPEEGLSKFTAATNGVTLSKTPQPVPGGLAGLVNCKEITNFLVRIGCEAVFENGLTGVNATLELAKPASEIRVGELNLAFEEGIALKLPVKVHLENPLLGSECYVGSSSSPIIWNLTTGETKPPVGTTPIHGKGGKLRLFEESQIAEISGAELVENAWSAPGASGCGGFGVELILNPIINAAVGVPSAAGKNVAALQDQIFISRAEAVNAH
jgi:hypothetical protein